MPTDPLEMRVQGEEPDVIDVGPLLRIAEKAITQRHLHEDDRDDRDCDLFPPQSPESLAGADVGDDCLPRPLLF